MKDRNTIFTLRRKFDTIKTLCDVTLKNIGCGNVVFEIFETLMRFKIFYREIIRK